MWSSGEDLAFSPPWPGFDSRHGNLLNLIDTLIKVDCLPYVQRELECQLNSKGSHAGIEPGPWR